MRNPFSTSIRLKLTALFLIVSLVPIAAVAFLSFDNTKNSLKDLKITDLNIVGEARESEVLLLLESLKARVLDFSSDRFITDSLTIINAGNSSITEELNVHLETDKAGIDSNLLVVDVIDLEGLVRASSDDERVGIDQSNNEVFLKGKVGIHVREPNPNYTTINGQITIPVSAPLSNKVTGEDLGVIVNYYSITPLDRALTGDLSVELGGKATIREIGQTVETYLVNSDRVMVTNSLFLENAPFRQEADTFPVHKCFTNNEEVTGIWDDYRGISVIGSSECLRIGDFTWTLLSEQDEDEAFGLVDSLRNQAIIAGTLASIIVGTLSFFLSNSISKPIVRMTRIAQKIADGDLDVRLEESGSKDEVGRLSNSFRRMLSNLKTVQGTLIESEKNLKQSQSIAHLGNWVLDHATKELTMSEECYRIFGVKPHEFGGTYAALLNTVHPEDRGSVERSFTNSLSDKTPDEAVYRVVRPDGKIRFVQGKREHSFDSQGKITRSIGTVLDITERKTVEDEKMRVMNSVARSIAHDIRNPLQAIRTASSLILDASKVERNELTSLIERDVIYADGIVKNLMDFASLPTPKLLLGNVNTLIRETLAQIVHPKNVELNTSYGNIPQVKIDKSQMSRVFSNLLINAVQAMPSGGELEIATRKIDEFIEIKIKDTGVGISKKDIPKIFDPFFTTKAKGSGLGLPSVKRIIESHDGTINVDSKIGSGTTITVRLPIGTPLSV